MHTMSHHASRERLHHDAIERARELRREAISEFWRATDQWFTEALHPVQRAAHRLAARLRQHAKRRAAGG